MSSKASPISPLVQWDHSKTWLTPKLKPVESFVHNVHIGLSNPDYTYLEGHQIDDRVLIPAMTYVVRKKEKFVLNNERIRYLY